MAVNTEPSRDRRRAGTVTQQDRETMRRLGAAMAEPRGKAHGMTLVQVLERVEELNRDIPPPRDHDKGTATRPLRARARARSGDAQEGRAGE